MKPADVNHGDAVNGDLSTTRIVKSLLSRLTNATVQFQLLVQHEIEGVQDHFWLGQRR